MAGKHSEKGAESTGLVADVIFNKTFKQPLETRNGRMPATFKILYARGRGRVRYIVKM